jgi:hypothetical protein
VSGGEPEASPSTEVSTYRLALDEQLEFAGVPITDRYGLLSSVWVLLPYLAQEFPDIARDFRADVRSLVGEAGSTEESCPPGAPASPPRSPGRAAGVRRKV